MGGHRLVACRLRVVELCRMAMRSSVESIKWKAKMRGCLAARRKSQWNIGASANSARSTPGISLERPAIKGQRHLSLMLDSKFEHRAVTHWTVILT